MTDKTASKTVPDSNHKQTSSEQKSRKPSQPAQTVTKKKCCSKRSVVIGVVAGAIIIAAVLLLAALSRYWMAPAVSLLYSEPEAPYLYTESDAEDVTEKTAPPEWTALVHQRITLYVPYGKIEQESAPDSDPHVFTMDDGSTAAISYGFAPEYNSSTIENAERGSEQTVEEKVLSTTINTLKTQSLISGQLEDLSFVLAKKSLADSAPILSDLDPADMTVPFVFETSAFTLYQMNNISAEDAGTKTVVLLGSVEPQDTFVDTDDSYYVAIRISSPELTQEDLEDIVSSMLVTRTVKEIIENPTFELEPNPL